MGWAQKRVARIQSAVSRTNALRQDAKEVREIAAADSAALCEILFTAVERITRELREGLPLAQASDLRSERLNANNLTVSTRVQPVVPLEIVHYPGKGIGGKIHKTYSSREPVQAATLSMIRLAVDPQMGLWYSDGERYLHPSTVAEELMEEVASFFETAATRPRMVS